MDETTRANREVAVRRAVRRDAHWVGGDLDSRTKYALALRKQFRLPLPDVERIIHEVARERALAGRS
jgi:hypothetical protein